MKIFLSCRMESFLISGFTVTGTDPGHEWDLCDSFAEDWSDLGTEFSETNEHFCLGAGKLEPK